MVNAGAIARLPIKYQNAYIDIGSQRVLRWIYVYNKRGDIPLYFIMFGVLSFDAKNVYIKWKDAILG